MRAPINRLPTKYIKPLIFIGVFILIGSAIFLLATHAVSPTASLEPEQGTLTGNATIGSDTGASNGKYVQFSSGNGSGALAIKVSGNHLIDAQGSTTRIHGVDVSGTEFSCVATDHTPRGYAIGVQPDGNYDANTPILFDTISSWHANAVRIPLNEDCWLGLYPTGTYGINPAYSGTNYQNAIAMYVAAAHKAGLYVILDLHFSAAGNYLASNQQPMADADHSITFWQQVASAYKTDPATIFDLYNEPFLYWIADGTDIWECWLNGCSQNQLITGSAVQPDGSTTGYTVNYSWRTAGMQQLIAAVRGTGAINPVLVNGVGWAGDDSGWLTHQPTDPAGQMIAGTHVYPSATANGVSNCQTESCWDGIFASNLPPALEQHYPVLMGETGDHTNAPVSSFFPAILNYSDAHNWSYMAWTFNAWGDADNVLIQNINGTPTTGEGAFYKSRLLAEFP